MWGFKVTDFTSTFCCSIWTLASHLDYVKLANWMIFFFFFFFALMNNWKGIPNKVMGDCVCCIQRTPTSSSFTILKKKEKKKTPVRSSLPSTKKRRRNYTVWGSVGGHRLNRDPSPRAATTCNDSVPDVCEFPAAPVADEEAAAAENTNGCSRAGHTH